MGQVTIGTDTFEVYGTEAERETYMNGKLGTPSYDAASADDKNKAHVSATRWIDRENWQNERTDQITPQPLDFPRIGLIDCNGEVVPDNVVPIDIENATYELIEILLTDAAASASANTGSNVKVAKGGSAQVEFFRPGADSSGGPATIFPTEVQKLVRCFLEAGVGTGGNFASGTAAESSFDDCDIPGLTEGYP